MEVTNELLKMDVINACELKNCVTVLTLYLKWCCSADLTQLTFIVLQQAILRPPPRTN